MAYKVYRSGGEHREDTKVKDRLGSCVWSCVEAAIRVDSQFQKFGELASKTGSIDCGRLLDAIRRATRIQIKSTSEDGAVNNVRLIICSRRLKNSILDNLDNNIINKCRRRTPSKGAVIPFIDEILGADKEHVYSFRHNAKTNQVVNIANNNSHWSGRLCWIEKIMLAASQQCNDNIYFEGWYDDNR